MTTSPKTRRPHNELERARATRACAPRAPSDARPLHEDGRTTTAVDDIRTNLSDAMDAIESFDERAREPAEAHLHAVVAALREVERLVGVLCSDVERERPPADRSAPVAPLANAPAIADEDDPLGTAAPTVLRPLTATLDIY